MAKMIEDNNLDSSISNYLIKSLKKSALDIFGKFCPDDSNKAQTSAVYKRIFRFESEILAPHIELQIIKRRFSYFYQQ